MGTKKLQGKTPFSYGYEGQYARFEICGQIPQSNTRNWFWIVNGFSHRLSATKHNRKSSVTVTTITLKERHQVKKRT